MLILDQIITLIELLMKEIITILLKTIVTILIGLERVHSATNQVILLLNVFVNLEILIEIDKLI